MGPGMQGLLLVRRGEEDEMFVRLTKSWCFTTKFIVQFVKIIHEIIARCLLYYFGVYEDCEF